DRLLIAVCRRPVGVDIEKTRTIPDLEALAAEVFSDEELASWQNVSRGADAFLGLWTRKEALLKGIGLGITQHLKSVSVFFDDTWRVSVPRVLTREDWTLRTFHGSEEVWSLGVPFSSPRIEKFGIPPGH